MSTICKQSRVKLETGDSLQRIFNVAWKHFIEDDNPPAVDYNEELESYQCKYLTTEDRKCAIGLCIPEGHPAQNYKGSLFGIVKNYPELFPDIVNMDIYDLNGFQNRLHDKLQDSGTWRFTKEERKNRYLAVAKEYNLTVPEHSS